MQFQVHKDPPFSVSMSQTSHGTYLCRVFTAHLNARPAGHPACVFAKSGTPVGAGVSQGLLPPEAVNGLEGLRGPQAEETLPCAGLRAWQGAGASLGTDPGEGRRGRWRGGGGAGAPVVSVGAAALWTRPGCGRRPPGRLPGWGSARLQGQWSCLGLCPTGCPWAAATTSLLPLLDLGQVSPLHACQRARPTPRPRRPGRPPAEPQWLGVP